VVGGVVAGVVVGSALAAPYYGPYYYPGPYYPPPPPVYYAYPPGGPYDPAVPPPPGAYGGGNGGGATAGGSGYPTIGRGNAPASGVPLGGPTADAHPTTRAPLGRYSEYCGEDVRDIASVPITDIQRAIQTNDAQRAALDELGNASVQAAQIIKAACPTDIASTPLGHIDAMQQRVQAMLNGVKIVRRPLEGFYNTLNDEQKARIDALGQSPSGPQGAGVGSPISTCNTRAIPDWSTSQVEKSLRPSPAQRESFTVLQTAAAKARDMLQTSCPGQMPTTTPVRIAAIEQRLQSILAAIQTLRGPLNDFYNSLSDNQKAQFNTIGGAFGSKPG
jgi:hypothetical protein